jgi:hypothetical protein
MSVVDLEKAASVDDAIQMYEDRVKIQTVSVPLSIFEALVESHRMLREIRSVASTRDARAGIDTRTALDTKPTEPGRKQRVLSPKARESLRQCAANARAAKARRQVAERPPVEMAPVPTDHDLNLVGTAGWVKARIIEHAANGLMVGAIYEHVREWVTVAQVQELVEKSQQKIDFCKTTQGQARVAYLNGLAIAHNKLVDKNLKFQRSA